MKSVYIVILNWNRKVDTVECIKSVAKLSKRGYKITTVVVDNNSADGSQAEIEKVIKGTGSILIVNDSNLGFAAGNNVGINYALYHKADYVVVLNNDTRLDPNLINRLFDKAEKNTDGAAFSPKIYFERGFEFHKERYKKEEFGKVIWSAGGSIDWANIFGVNRGVDEVDKGQFDKQVNVDFATGACVMYRASALKKTGVFDEKYFMYFEDVDLSVRLLRAGYKIVYVPDAVLWHKVAQSSAIGGGLNDYFISRNRLLFGLKYASIRTKFALLREAYGLLLNGRQWQRTGVRDFFVANFGKGSWV